MSYPQPLPPISVPAESDDECLTTPFWDGRTPAVVDGVVLLTPYWNDTLTLVTPTASPYNTAYDPTSPARLRL